jgi:hypothetical protein
MKKILPFVLAVAFGMSACSSGDDNGNGGDTFQDENPLLCTGDYVTGRGNVWRGHDPGKLQERDIPCLDGDGSLSGYYVDSIRASSGEAAFSEENRFLYESDDDRLNQVEAYYVITHMANWMIGYFTPASDFENVVQMVRSDEVTLYYDRAEVESKQLCYSLEIGMQGVSGTFLNVDIFSHELGHHLLFSLNRQIANSMIHEAMADYLAACFTRDSTIEPSEWPGFDRNVDNDWVAPDKVITRGEYCSILLGRMEDDGIDQVYPSLAQTFTQCRNDDPQEPQPHWAGMILSGALWDLRGEIGEADFHPVLFRALHFHAINDTGDLMDALIEEDQDLNAGANQERIRSSFEARGIDQNLNRDFPDIPYPQCP